MRGDGWIMGSGNSWAPILSRGAVSGLTLLFVCFMLATSQGSERDRRLFNDQIETGEFGPALQTVGRFADPEVRDELRQRVALAQIEAGADQAAMRTTSSMENDWLRADAWNDVMSTSPPGSRGGAQADFDTLIDLIITVVAPESWDDVGGQGSIREFPNGVFVDAAGVIRRSTKVAEDDTWRSLTRVASDTSDKREVRKSSALRKVSLNRLEKLVGLHLSTGLPLDEEMLFLAGLRRVDYLAVIPETNDIILAGPAGDWRMDAQGRTVGLDDDWPLLRLHDLVELMRQAEITGGAPFGCSIEPTETGLRDVQLFLDQTKGRAIPSARRRTWLEQVRRALGKQKIEVFGVDPTTRVGSIIVAADYHMKLVGLGLEPGTPNVPGYLDLLASEGGSPSGSLDVLRWWFVADFENLARSTQHDLFHLGGRGVTLLSQNELLSRLGKVIHTGQSEELNRRFAKNFNEDFAGLAEKYPIYAELRNVFNLALVASLLHVEDLPGQVGWTPESFLEDPRLELPHALAPQWVETVINHRVVNRVQILAGVSGGVQVDTKAIVQDAPTLDGAAEEAARESVLRGAQESSHWWWD